MAQKAQTLPVFSGVFLVDFLYNLCTTNPQPVHKKSTMIGSLQKILNISTNPQDVLQQYTTNRTNGVWT